MGSWISFGRTNCLISFKPRLWVKLFSTCFASKHEWKQGQVKICYWLLTDPHAGVGIKDAIASKDGNGSELQELEKTTAAITQEYAPTILPKKMEMTLLGGRVLCPPPGVGHSRCKSNGNWFRITGTKTTWHWQNNCAEEEKMEMTLWGAASSVLLHRVTAAQNLIHRGHCSEVLENYKN